jgi:hypothetical protein
MASGFETARVPTAIALNPVDEYLSQDPYGTTPFEQPMGPPGPLAFGPQMAGNLAAPYMYPQQGMMAQGPQMGQQGPQGMQGPPAPQGIQAPQGGMQPYGTQDLGTSMQPPMQGAPQVSPLSPGQPSPGPYSQPKSGMLAQFLQSRGISPQQYAWNVATAMTGVTNPQQMFQNMYTQQQLKQRGEIARQSQATRNEDRQYRRQYQQQTAQDRQQWKLNQGLTGLADRLSKVDAWDDFTEALGHAPETAEDLRKGTAFYAEAKGRHDKVKRRNKRLGTLLNEGWRTGKPASIATDSEFSDDPEAHEQVAMMNSIIEARQERLREMEGMKKAMLRAKTGLAKKQEAGKLTDVEKAALRMLSNDLAASNTMAGRARTALAKEELADMELWPGRIAELEDLELEMMDRINQTLTQVQALNIPIGEYAGVQGDVYTPSTVRSTQGQGAGGAPPPSDEDDVLDRYFAE